MVVGTVASNTGKVCCSYGAASSLTAKQGFDCVHIPGAVGDSDRPAPVKSNICGNGRGLAVRNMADIEIKSLFTIVIKNSVKHLLNLAEKKGPPNNNSNKKPIKKKVYKK